MAARADRPPVSLVVSQGRVSSWLTTVDHKRIGILYIVTSLVFFLAGGVLALLMRAQLATPDEHIVTRNSYNELFTMHGTTMVFLVVVPIWAGLGELPRAADDRRARHGLPAAERALVLALPVRRDHPLLELVRRRRRPARGLDGLRAALGGALHARATGWTSGSCRCTS